MKSRRFMRSTLIISLGSLGNFSEKARVSEAQGATGIEMVALFMLCRLLRKRFTDSIVQFDGRS
jgi:hypothetical protein